MHRPEAPNHDLRLADLLAALSLVTDLGMGHPPEEAMRTCLLATELARRTRLPENDIADVYWTSLLMHIGCTAFAHEQAALFGGDEIAVNDIGSRTDFGNSSEAMSFLLELGRARAPLQRARILFVGLARGDRFGRDVAAATCEVAASLAARLGLGGSVQRALYALFERWDGKGAPHQLAGEAIAIAARVSQLAAQATVFDRLGGVDAAREMVRRRAGTGLDPELAGAFARHAEEILAGLDGCDPWALVIEAEPAPQQWVADEALDEIGRAFADAVDLKFPHTLGHSRGVAELAERAGRALGLAEREVACLRRAAFFHDLGRVAVPNGVWEKPAALTSAEWEQVRLHPYHSERILSRSPVLEPLGAVAGLHHERLDGSGYHRRAAASGIAPAARVLAAADVFQAMTQARPHRAALEPSAAAEQLRADARAGRLDPDAVNCVLAAAGQRRQVPPPEAPVSGLTERELDVLRLLARGHTNKQMGRQLFISPKTVGHHVEHIYQKLGVSSRAAAALFAVQNHLVH